MDSNAESLVIEERKKKVIAFLKSKYTWVVYFVLAIITYISLYIRTRNIPGLKDITTGTWTLGPDLDPFLFLRYAKYIVEHGKIMALDMMRYVPIGYNTAKDFPLHFYSIAWFHKIAALFGSDSVTFSAIIFPVVMFGLTIVAFFLFVRKVFTKSQGIKKANIIALVSCLFLSLMPSLLPRTIAGIPEKESAAFFYMFLAFYFFLCSWEAKNKRQGYLFAILAGIFTGAMALVWGGYLYLFFIIGGSVLAAFILGSVSIERLKCYALWIVSSFAVMIIFSARYTLVKLASSLGPAFITGVLAILLVDKAVHNTKIKRYFEGERIRKIPPRILSLILSVVLLAVLSSAIFGLSFIPTQISEIYHNLIRPSTTRLIQTVAENRQPYFGEWAGSFGPNLKGVPLGFWMFFIGSIILFYSFVKNFEKKQKYSFTVGYVLMLSAIAFSRYSSSSTLNGENFISVLIYALGVLLFLVIAGVYYHKNNKENKMDEFQKLDFGIILALLFFLFSIVSARGIIRLILVLAVPASIMTGYLFTSAIVYIRKSFNKENKIIAIIIGGIIIIATIFTAYSMYNESKAVAQGYVPGPYNQQWQKAMAWVRESTPQNAVFGHWWDYGYWVQSIGERATVLDGGNSISYWNHLMGRYGLTEPVTRDSLDFLYAHNTTHFLIDSTDIGKYGAFSLIGSDQNYDRKSWIAQFERDNSQTGEKKNSTIYWYSGGISLDEDIKYDYNGTQIFMPGNSNKAGIGAILAEVDPQQNVKSVSAVFVSGGQQYVIPLRYYHDNGLVDLGSGLDAGVFFMPRLNIDDSGSGGLESKGGLLYLSRRTLHSQLVRLYLFDEKNDFFELKHTESDFLINNLKDQGINAGEFVDFRGFRGPIKIWEIHYPSDIKFNEEFVSTKYPESLKRA